MELVEAIESRRSIRAYKPIPVPRKTLTQILELAIRAPSYDNAQPWGFTILGGGVLNDLREALQQQFLAGVEPHPDFPLETVAGIHRIRYAGLAKTLFQLLAIAREDKEKRKQWMLKMIRFFDAPNAIIVTADSQFSGHYSMFCLGAASQNIALAAVNFGLGTCLDVASIVYPEVIRRIAGIPESKKVAIGVAIGYPDWDFPANELRSAREPLENLATWCGA
jgi:nitroreductase